MKTTRLIAAATTAILSVLAAPAYAQGTGLGQGDMIKKIGDAGQAENNRQGQGPWGQNSCCYDYSNETKNKNNIIDTFTKEINAMQLAIIEALRLGAGQLSGNMREQTTAQNNTQNVVDDRNVVSNVEKARLDAIKSAASGASTCNVATSSSGGNLGKTVETTRAAMTTQMTDWATGNGDSPSSQGADIAIQARLTQHCSKYASTADQVSGLCPSANGGQLANADIDISKSLFWTDKTGHVGSLPAERYTAAQLFIINAMDPTPDGRMRSGEAQTAVGREMASHITANAARMSVATDTANFILAEFAASSGGQTATTSGAMDTVSWAKQMAPQVIGMTDKDYSNGISWYDWMELRSKAWFMNPTWLIKMDGQSGEQAQKDSAAILSFIAYQNWEQYRLALRQTMTLATMLAIQVDNIRGRGRQ